MSDVLGILRSVSNEIFNLLEQGLLALIDVPDPLGVLVVVISCVPDFAVFFIASIFAFLHPAFLARFPSLLLGAVRPFAPPVEAIEIVMIP